MTTTPLQRRRAAQPAPVPGSSDDVEVLGLDAADALGWVVGQRRVQDLAAARELRGVAHWADLHRVGRADIARGLVGAAHPDVSDSFDRRDAFEKKSTGPQGVEGVLRSAGEGAFMVEEYAVSELATALGLGEAAGRAYVGQAVELRDRLPRCWAQVMCGALPAWKARRIAERTIPLQAATADAVDASLAPFAGRLSVGRIERAVDAATLRLEPEVAAERDAAAADKRGVWLEDRLDGTTDLAALLDTPDAHALDHALDTVATTLGKLGDGDRREVRRARALGVLADPQYSLDLGRAAEQLAQERAGEGQPGPSGPPGPLGRSRPFTSTCTSTRCGPWSRVAAPSPARTRPAARRATGSRWPTTSLTSSASTGPVSGSAPGRPRRSSGGWSGSRPAAGSPSLPSSTRPPRSRSTPTRSRPDYAGRSSSVTPPAPSRGAATPDGTTSTTSTPGDHPTRAVHPGRPGRRTCRGCAASTTGSRPTATGPSSATCSQVTSPGPALSRAATSSLPPAPVLSTCPEGVRAKRRGSQRSRLPSSRRGCAHRIYATPLRGCADQLSAR